MGLLDDSYQPSRKTSNGLAGSIAISVAVGSILFLVIIILRKKFPKYFMPKAYHTQGLKNPPDINKCSGWFNWITYAINYKEELLFQEYGGLDMVHYLTFLRYSIGLFAVLFLVGIPSLITNITGDGGLSNEDVLSMGNISQKSNRFWVHAISVAVVTFVFFAWIWKFEKKTTAQRANYLKKDNPISRSVLVSEIEEEYCTTSSLKQLFRSLYGRKQIGSAYVVPNVSNAEKIREKRAKEIASYQKVYMVENDTKKEQFKRTKICCGPKCKATEYYGDKINLLDDELRNEQNNSIQSTRTGFVTFNSIGSALLCAQARHHRNSKKMTIDYAPDPNEIKWSNLRVRANVKTGLYILSSVLLVLLFFFWTIPIVFIGGFTNAETLEQTKGFGWLSFVLNLSPFVNGIVTGFLPGLALIIFMALLPKILNAILGLRKYFLKSQQDRAVGFAYWLFLLLFVFLVITIAGSATRSLEKYINSPSEIPKDLATSIPSQALFYFNYIAINSFINNFVFLLGIPDIIIYILKYSATKSQWAKSHASIPSSLPYQKVYPSDLIIMTIGIVYCVMNPILSAIACVYFSISYFAVKNYMIFKQKPEYDGILMNKLVSTASLTSIFIFLLTMIGIFSVNVFAPGFIALVCFILTIFFTVALLRQYSKIETIAPLMDFKRCKTNYYSPESLYKPPSLFPPTPLDQLGRLEDAEHDLENQKEEFIYSQSITKSEEIQLDQNGNAKSTDPNSIGPN